MKTPRIHTDRLLLREIYETDVNDIFGCWMQDEDVSRYMYSCVFHRRCCICGKKADIHEVEKVGMGRNRTKIHHLNQAVQPLCRSHHMEEENLGQKAFDEKYHLQFIRLDYNLCKKLKWRI